MASSRPGAGARAQWRRRHLHAWPGAGASRGRAAVTCPQFSEHCPPVSGFAGCQVTRYPVPGNKNSRKQESWHGCVEEGPYRHTHTHTRWEDNCPEKRKRPTHTCFFVLPFFNKCEEHERKASRAITQAITRLAVGHRPTSKT